MTSFNLNYLLKTLSPNNVTFGGFHIRIWEDTVQSTGVSLRVKIAPKPNHGPSQVIPHLLSHRDAATELRTKYHGPRLQMKNPEPREIKPGPCATVPPPVPTPLTASLPRESSVSGTSGLRFTRFYSKESSCSLFETFISQKSSLTTESTCN